MFRTYWMYIWCHLEWHASEKHPRVVVPCMYIHMTTQHPSLPCIHKELCSFFSCAYIWVSYHYMSRGGALVQSSWYIIHAPAHRHRKQFHFVCVCVCGGGGGGGEERGKRNIHCDRGDLRCMYDYLEVKYWGGPGPALVSTPMSN